MVNTKKFSEFAVQTLTDGAAEVVGLEAGVNVQSVRFLSWNTAGRPAAPFNGLLGINTTLQMYEYWDAIIGAWTQLSTNINILALLASHTVNQGASLIGLQNQSGVTNKFVQDLANAKFIAQTDNGTLQNGQFLGSLTTGIVKNTTGTGVLSISAPLTSIDGLVTVANEMLYTTGANTYATTVLTPFSRGLFADVDAAAWRASLGVTPGGGTVTSISAGTGITLTPDPITTTGSVNLTIPVLPTLGGTGLLTYVLGDTLYSSAADTLASLAGNTTTTKMFLSQTGTGVVSAAPAWSTVSASDIVSPAALTKTDDTNVTLTLGGSPSVALLAATSLTLGWTGELAVSRGGSGLAAATIHNLMIGNGTSPFTLLPPSATSGIPLISQGAAADPAYGTAVVSGGGTGNTTFTAYSLICAGTTATGAFQNVSGVGTLNQVLVSQGAGALPAWGSVPGLTPAALTKTDDTNVTLTLGGTPTTALLQATSITLGWTGQLSVARGGTGLAAVTAHNLMIGNATSPLTLLAPNATTGIPLVSQGAAADPAYSTAVVSGGGTGNTTFTAFAVLCAGTTATGAFQNVVGVGTVGQVLTSAGAGALPAWANAPGTGTINSGSINQLAWYAANGTTISGLSTGNNGILVTSSGGVPSISSTLPQAVLNNIPAPTVQKFTSGSGTYTTPANCKYIRVVAVAGGGGGGGSGTSNGGAQTAGGDTTFGSVITMTGGGAGSAGVFGGNGGAGGAATTNTTSPGGFAVAGGNGFGGVYGPTTTGVLNTPGGSGGNSILGGAGASYFSTGVAAQTNTGGGGAGGACVAAGPGGGGGGAGAGCDVLITSPAATYAYAVGAGGTAGAAGTNGAVGYAGGSGIITVYEFYV